MLAEGQVSMLLEIDFKQCARLDEFEAADVPSSRRSSSEMRSMYMCSRAHS